MTEHLRKTLIDAFWKWCPIRPTVKTCDSFADEILKSEILDVCPTLSHIEKSLLGYYEHPADNDFQSGYLMCLLDLYAEQRGVDNIPEFAILLGSVEGRRGGAESGKTRH